MLKSKTVPAFFAGVVLLTMAAGLLSAEEIVYDSGKRRDPFVPLVGDMGSLEAGSSSGFKLEGIIYDPGGRSLVILNGNSYQVGDVAGDVTVTKIGKDHVVILVDGEEKTLWMREEEKP